MGIGTTSSSEVLMAGFCFLTSGGGGPWKSARSLTEGILGWRPGTKEVGAAPEEAIGLRFPSTVMLGSAWIILASRSFASSNRADPGFWVIS